jgi:hypothetical protein
MKCYGILVARVITGIDNEMYGILMTRVVTDLDNEM